MDVREKLVELLGADVCKHDCCEDCEYAENRDACIAFLKERMAGHLIANGIGFVTDNNVPSKWISVKDRLPEEMEKVMAFVNGVRITAVLKGGVWLSSWNHDPVNDDVTHWMPLPQPPKGE